MIKAISNQDGEHHPGPCYKRLPVTRQAREIRGFDLLRNRHAAPRTRILDERLGNLDAVAEEDGQPIEPCQLVAGHPQLVTRLEEPRHLDTADTELERVDITRHGSDTEQGLLHAVGHRSRHRQGRSVSAKHIGNRQRLADVEHRHDTGRADEVHITVAALRDRPGRAAHIRDEDGPARRERHPGTLHEDLFEAGHRREARIELVPNHCITVPGPSLARALTSSGHDFDAAGRARLHRGTTAHADGSLDCPRAPARPPHAPG